METETDRWFVDGEDQRHRQRMGIMPRIYKTDVASEADLRVYVSDIRGEADLIVFETADAWAATEAPIWTYTPIIGLTETTMFSAARKLALPISSMRASSIAA